MDIRQNMIQLSTTIVPLYLQKCNKLQFFPSGIFFSEGLAFCIFAEIFNIDMIIESGIRSGVSTNILLSFFGNRISLHSNDINTFPETSNTVKHLRSHENWKFHVGDGMKVIPDILADPIYRDRKIAILIDGPKYADALELSKKCFNFNNVKFVAMHDMNTVNCPQEHPVIRDLQSWKNYLFNTDVKWFRDLASDIDDKLASKSPHWKRFKMKYPYGCGLAFVVNPLDLRWRYITGNIIR